ncbi:hypothetical protein ACFQ5N_06860 [Lutibacter holmesii]|uniref:Uncharacterized protein n=1 Tax=Lutibacter holmesii TaxID=1137985 RepID=A0ABW3WNA7_9FLAO
MKRYALLNLLCFFIAINMYSQQYMDGQMTAQVQNAYHKVLGLSRESTPLEENIVGTQYFNEDFTIGQLYMNSKKYGKKIPLRYNAYVDDIEIELNNQISFIKKLTDLTATINNETYTLKSFYTKEDIVESGYLIELYITDSLKLYKQTKKVFKEGRVAQTSLTTSTPPKLVDYIYYYIQLNETVLPQKIKKSKKEISSIFPTHKTEIKKYLKENNVNIKNEASIIALCKYYSSLN